MIVFEYFIGRNATAGRTFNKIVIVEKRLLINQFVENFCIAKFLEKMDALYCSTDSLSYCTDETHEEVHFLIITINVRLTIVLEIYFFTNFITSKNDKLLVKKMKAV